MGPKGRQSRLCRLCIMKNEGATVAKMCNGCPSTWAKAPSSDHTGWWMPPEQEPAPARPCRLQHRQGKR